MEPANKRPPADDKENNGRRVRSKQGDAASGKVANENGVRVPGAKRALSQHQTETVAVNSSVNIARVIVAEGAFGKIYREVHNGSRRGFRRSTSVTKETQLALVTKHGVTASQLAAECSTLQKLAHLHVVGFRSVRWTKGDVFCRIHMEFLEGQTMVSRMGVDPAPAEADIIDWALQIASALSFCHDREVVHGDLRPENIFLNRQFQSCRCKDRGF
jgi:hypothetical protein